MAKGKIGSELIKKHLLSKEGDDKIVVLFEDSKIKKGVSGTLGSVLRQDPAIITNRSIPFRAQNNLLELGKRKVIFGLVDDEKFLISHYSEGIIKYYDEDAEKSDDKG